ncbi:MAG: YqeG family HAD IIIA-type phosphatase [Candidatus Izemoplasmatales bacterium]|jgi:hypothetical protein|nr:YqeG family HAD IIIA-type phosphatase [Candidatus Izemoplasmatales bacterium]MDD4595268.1 YqeG family HAD IIIA-type phosphatase [Candidatus Izemoplasmatales bacterium]
MIELLVRETLFIPDDYQKTIYDINYAQLATSGIKTILMDLDNTIIPYDESHASLEMLALFASVKSKGLGIVIISNNHGLRVKGFANEVQCLYVDRAKKPFSCGFKKAVKLGETKNPSEICVIGDQLMTDVWGGKRLGYRTIIVDALKRNTEKWYTRFNRRLEQKILLLIQKKHPELFKKLHLAEKR